MAVNFNKFKGAAAKEKLENQASAPRQSEGEGNGGGYGIFDLAKAPYEVKSWKPKKGENLILIVPVEVTSRDNPAFRSGAIDLGEYDYGVSLYTHMGKGTVAGLSHVCLKRNYGKNCPRCAEFFRGPENGGTYVKGVKGSGNSDHASSERNYFLVVPFTDANTPDEENMGLWNSPANFKTGFAVVDRAKEMADGQAIIPFWWPTDDGRLVSFHMFQASEKDFPEYSKIKFVKRPTALAEKLAEKYSFPLDSLLIVKTADQINSDIFGGPGHEEAQETARHEAPRTPAAKEPEEPEMDPDAFGAPEPVEAKEPEPEATPAPKAPEAATGSQCPYGHAYGTDWGDTPNCKMCRREHKDLEAVCAEGGN
jgi:hypothetical protein